MSTDAYIILIFAMSALALMISLSDKPRRQITVVRLVQPPLKPLSAPPSIKTISDIQLPFEEVSHV